MQFWQEDSCTFIVPNELNFLKFDRAEAFFRVSEQHLARWELEVASLPSLVWDWMQLQLFETSLHNQLWIVKLTNVGLNSLRKFFLHFNIVSKSVDQTILSLFVAFSSALLIYEFIGHHLNLLNSSGQFLYNFIELLLWVQNINLRFAITFVFNNGYFLAKLDNLTCDRFLLLVHEFVLLCTDLIC